MGREAILSDEKAINILTQSFFESSIKVKTLVLELLSAICYLDEGHAKVLKALDHYRDFAQERVRFQVGLCVCMLIIAQYEHKKLFLFHKDTFLNIDFLNFKLKFTFALTLFGVAVCFLFSILLHLSLI